MINTNYRAFYLLAALVVAFTSQSIVVAGTLSTTPLAINDGFGPDGGYWRGSVDIVGGPSLGSEIELTVDYAVFEPQNFDVFLKQNGFSGSAPSVALELIYAYQLVDIVHATPGVSNFTVGLDDLDARGSISAPSFVTTGLSNEVSPLSEGGDQGTSMRWNFGGYLGPNDESSILIYSSPSAPELDFVQAQSGLASPLSPTPKVASISNRIHQFDVIPEPSSLLLIGLTSLTIAGYRKIGPGATCCTSPCLMKSMKERRFSSALTIHLMIAASRS